MFVNESWTVAPGQPAAGLVQWASGKTLVAKAEVSLMHYQVEGKTGLKKNKEGQTGFDSGMLLLAFDRVKMQH